MYKPHDIYPESSGFAGGRAATDDDTLLSELYEPEPGRDGYGRNDELLRYIEDEYGFRPEQKNDPAAYFYGGFIPF